MHGVRYNLALEDQPYFVEASSPLNQGVCLLLFVVGTTLVLSSFWVLGITGVSGDMETIIRDLF